VTDMVRVVFSKKAPSGPLASDTIAIWPSDNQWNDFGKRYLFKCLIALGKSSAYEMTIKLAFVGVSESPHVFLTEKLANEPGFVSKTSLPDFYSILPSLQDYRSLVDRFGADSKSLLQEMNDLVTASAAQTPHWLALERTTDNYTQGIMRANETHFALHNAIDVLDGVGQETVSGFSDSLQIKCRIRNFHGPHEFRLEFSSSSLLPQRLSVLIGENGVGKTQILAKIARSLLRGGRAVTDGSGGRPSMSRLVALDAPRVGPSPFPKRAPPNSPMRYMRLSLYRQDARLGFGDLLVRLARSEDRIAKLSRIDLFMNAVTAVGNIDEIVLRTTQGSWTSLAEIAAQSGGPEQKSLAILGGVSLDAEPFWRNEKAPVPLSSGQRAFIVLLAQVCLAIERATLVLMDEPETHLHPAFIRRMVSAIDQILTDTGSAAIIATHSVYFVREVAREQVVILKRSAEGVPEISRPVLKTLGADVGAISFFVFGDETNAVLVDRLEKRLSEDPIRRHEAIDSLVAELSLEARSQLQQ
jgi:predicted ATPase